MSEFFGKEISGPYTIPSGIVTTAVPIIQRVMDTVPEVGVITTKSIGLEPRKGNLEPIINQYAPGCYVNAVGLTNPGAEQFALELEKLVIPDDKFLLISIFGGFWREFIEVATILAPYADGFELNLSCPHAHGFGADIGSDPFEVQTIIYNMKEHFPDTPVIAKLSPNMSDQAFMDIVNRAMEAEIDGFCLINTTGPGLVTHDGEPVLSNGKGGMSGAGTLPIGVKLTQLIRDRHSEIPIIGCGGVKNGQDAKAYFDAGANIVGVGSSLGGVQSAELPAVFANVDRGRKGRSNAIYNQYVDTEYYKVKLIKNDRVADDIAILTFDSVLAVHPGQFVYLWIPGVGEKPFSIMDSEANNFAIQDFGEFTNHLINLEPGAFAYMRGPYGTSLNRANGICETVTVTGGTGLAAVYDWVAEERFVKMFMGARSKDRLYYVDECRKTVSNENSNFVRVATDDGSEGYHGNVVDMLKEYLLDPAAEEWLPSTMFVVCGPEPMVDATVKLLRMFVEDENIIVAIDYVTKCGIGICGSCTTPDGQRSCVDGPFIRLAPPDSNLEEW